MTMIFEIMTTDLRISNKQNKLNSQIDLFVYIYIFKEFFNRFAQFIFVKALVHWSVTILLCCFLIVLHHATFSSSTSKIRVALGGILFCCQGYKFFSRVSWPYNTVINTKFIKKQLHIYSFLK